MIYLITKFNFHLVLTVSSLYSGATYYYSECHKWYNSHTKICSRDGWHHIQLTLCDIYYTDNPFF